MKKGKVDSAILIVLIAGIFWSFGALVVRFIEDAQSVPWQYLFFRGFTIFLLINFYLFVKEGKSFIKNYKKNWSFRDSWRYKFRNCHDVFYMVNNSYNSSHYTFNVGGNAFYDSNFRLYFSQRKSFKYNFNSNNCCSHRNHFYGL